MTGSTEEQQRILRFWWLLELFSPQSVPRLTSRATGAIQRQVIAWHPGEPLPWQTLARPRRLGSSDRTWQHTVYLGVYDLESTYESLHLAFGEDADAYDERTPGRSAAVGVLIDGDGRLTIDSAVLSSALWAVGRIEARGASEAGWAEGFTEATREFREAVEVLEGKRRSADGGDAAPAQDAESLGALARLAHELQGVSGKPDLATPAVVIQSVVVSARRAGDPVGTDFLNSLFLEDLAAVHTALAEGRGGGAALSSYLTSERGLDESARVDVLLDDRAADGGVRVERLPHGRWPSTPENGLSLRQQFAVNRALVDLGPGSGLMGVNGPPGTGKTTMLRDILSGNVVERARRLAALENAGDAFSSKTHRWKAGDGFPVTLRELRPALTGFEMVVASANNAAVENVTTEIPIRTAIDEPWRSDADYFADIAQEVLAAPDRGTGGQEPVDAWGLVAARLGNKRNRSAFQSAFWFDRKDPGGDPSRPSAYRGMQTRLLDWSTGAEPHRAWADARTAFKRAEERVELLLEQRRQAQERLARLPQLLEKDRRLAKAVDSLRTRLRDSAEERRACDRALSTARSDVERAVLAREPVLFAAPGVVRRVLSLGRATREWREELAPLNAAVRAASAARDGHQARLAEIDIRGERLSREVTSVETERAQATKSLALLERRLAVDEAIGAGYPGDAWTGDAREMHAPWLDARLDRARSELFLAALALHEDFLAALALHEDFLANNAAEMRKGLRAALDVVVGGGPRRLEPHKRRAAWQLFFLVVPLVSTTFASLGRMLGDIEQEGIGWLLIDEAGQACPQYAAGAIWRARRVVVVGDPLQLQPVVTMPRKAQRAIASAFGLGDIWIPPQASVQTLADRVSLHGTMLAEADRKVWVGAPLTVHRRCDSPMFTLCNEIAYGGMMVNGVKRVLDDSKKPDLLDSAAGPLVSTSRWLDVRALTSGTPLQENQIARLEKELADLADHGVSPDKVIAISPFRAVADRLAALSASYPGLVAGTIHTAQGREAPVVFLVLGGDPDSGGARDWAASSVNLVNVAASRASRRLYVIGDRKLWRQHDYFRDLAASLAANAGE